MNPVFKQFQEQVRQQQEALRHRQEMAHWHEQQKQMAHPHPHQQQMLPQVHKAHPLLAVFVFLLGLLISFFIGLLAGGAVEVMGERQAALPVASIVWLVGTLVSVTKAIKVWRS